MMEDDVDDPNYVLGDFNSEKDIDDPQIIYQDSDACEKQNFLLSNKIEIYMPVLKLAIDCLTSKKDNFDHATKSDYDKLSHLYHVFSKGDINEKLEMFDASESFLEQLYDRYKLNSSKRKSHPNCESTSTNLLVPSGSSEIVSQPLSLPTVPSTSNPLATPLTPIIHNCVATVEVGCKLDLVRIVLATRNTEFNPRRFHAVIMRLNNPRTVTLIFSTGKLVTTGAKNEVAAHLASRKCARILQKLGNNVKFKNFKIQNIVATCDVRFPVNIDNLYKTHCQFCNYEPELFPALIYRLVRPRVVFLIFVTGKFIITGAKDRDQLRQACEFIYPILNSSRKQ